MSRGSLPDVTGPAARRAVRYTQFTIGYHLIEGVIAVTAGLAASAISLIGFGVDSGIVEDDDDDDHGDEGKPATGPALHDRDDQP